MIAEIWRAACNELSSVAGQNQPQPDALSRGGFVEDLRAKLAAEYPEQAAEVEWKSSLGKETLLRSIRISCRRLPASCLPMPPARARRRRLVFECTRARMGSFEFTLREPKTELRAVNGKLGREPLRTIRQAGIMVLAFFGRAVFSRRTMARLRAQFDSAASSLVTTVVAAYPSWLISSVASASAARP